MSARARLQGLLGYAWAAAAVPIVLAAFVGMGGLAGRLVGWTGVTISPRYTGGAIERTVDCGEYLTRIHRPVFDALIGEAKTGFVQVDFVPLAAPGAPLPEAIDAEIDLDGDGTPDVGISAHPGPCAAEVTSLQPWVLGRDETVRLDPGMAVRVRLRNRPQRPDAADPLIPR